jgi:menaquinol-cytochrome c reductase iron-sulfur subunit
MTGSENRGSTPAPEHTRLSSEPDSPARRSFLVWVSAGAGGLAALLASLPFVGFLFAPMIRREPDVWRVVGSVEEFPIGTTQRVLLLDARPVPWAGFASRSAAWLRREAEAEFVAFSIHCTHTGCPVRWEEGAGLFLCPCHGGVFNRDGSVAAGPPPAPLERQPVRVRNGQVEIRTVGVPIPGG